MKYICKDNPNHKMFHSLCGMNRTLMDWDEIVDEQGRPLVSDPNESTGEYTCAICDKKYTIRERGWTREYFCEDDRKPREVLKAFYTEDLTPDYIKDKENEK